MKKKRSFNGDVSDNFIASIIRHSAGEHKIQHSVNEYLVAELYRNYSVNFFATIFFATFIFLELYQVEKIGIFYWYITLIVVQILRLGLMFTYRFVNKQYRRINLFHVLFFIGSSATALLWGTLGSFLMPPDLSHQMFIIVVINALIMGAANSLRSSYKSNILYSTLSLLPIIVWSLIKIFTTSWYYIGFFLLIVLLLSYSIFIARRAYSALKKSILLEYENRYLLELQVTHDILTGLFNRRYLMEFLKMELNRTERAAKPLAILLIDIDDFKKYNDKYSHDAGDFVLKTLSNCLSCNIRKSDVACRYGGEEFIIILTETDIETALERAEMIRAAVLKLSLIYQGNALGQMTISIGIAVFPENGKTVETIINAADNAMYKAKRLGKNKALIYTNSI